MTKPVLFTSMLLCDLQVEQKRSTRKLFKKIFTESKNNESLRNVKYKKKSKKFKTWQNNCVVQMFSIYADFKLTLFQFNLLIFDK